MLGKLLCKIGFHRERFAKDDRIGYGGVTAAIICTRCGKEIDPPIVWPLPEEPQLSVNNNTKTEQ
jgi:hypothetical protein